MNGDIADDSGGSPFDLAQKPEDLKTFRDRQVRPRAQPFSHAAFSARQTEIPNAFALSARFSVMPEPGKTTTPIGIV